MAIDHAGIAGSSPAVMTFGVGERMLAIGPATFGHVLFTVT
jgi:hypothetical protein